MAHNLTKTMKGIISRSDVCDISAMEEGRLILAALLASCCHCPLSIVHCPLSTDRSPLLRHEADGATTTTPNYVALTCYSYYYVWLLLHYHYYYYYYWTEDRAVFSHS